MLAKKLTSNVSGMVNRGVVVLLPGIATDGNLFRINTQTGELYVVDNYESFANFLTSLGFTVYIYHPSYSDRVSNRYVARHCKESRYYGQVRDVDSTLSFDRLVFGELIEFLAAVRRDAEIKNLFLVGFSQGGLAAAAYEAATRDLEVGKIAILGSPFCLKENPYLSLYFMPFINSVNTLSMAFSLEEHALAGLVTEKLGPTSTFFRLLPAQFFDYNPLADLLYWPPNMKPEVTKTMTTRVLEPIPAAETQQFLYFINEGRFTSMPKNGLIKYDYLALMENLGSAVKTRWLFVSGEHDRLATEDTVLAGKAAIERGGGSAEHLSVPTGHNDMVNGMENVKELVGAWLLAA